MHSILIFSIGVILVVIELFVVGAVIGIIGNTDNYKHNNARR